LRGLTPPKPLILNIRAEKISSAHAALVRYSFLADRFPGKPLCQLTAP
jgi:hypothetical protein